MKLIILGPPGSGKGTQAKLISNKYNIPALSTGAMLRDAMASGSELGLKVRNTVNRGDLISDDIVMNMVSETISHINGGFILDGFPRTIAQAEGLEDLLARLTGNLDIVILLQIDETALLDRVRQRIAEGSDGERQDDDPQVLVKRLEVYNKQTAPLIAYYDKKGLLVKINGMDPIAEVTAAIDKYLSAIGN